jgi:Tol biopolymer transport system component
LKRAAAFLLPLFLGCKEEPTVPLVRLVDRHRLARFSSDGSVVLYFRQDERPEGDNTLRRVNLASGADDVLTQAVIVGLDIHPTQNMVLFSAFAEGETEPALWLMGLDGSGLRRVTQSGAGHRWPSFSVDGTRVAWEVRSSGQQGLDTVRTLWIGDWLDTTIANGRAIAPGVRSGWSPDGGALAVEARRPGDERPRIILVVDTSGAVLDTIGFGTEPAWSPDGSTIAYLAEQAIDRGCLGVCFVDATGGDPRPLSTEQLTYGGSWSRDGLEFVYSRRMREYVLAGSGAGDITVEEARLWIRTLATGAERQVTF